jgi:hypothetical protein
MEWFEALKFMYENPGRAVVEMATNTRLKVDVEIGLSWYDTSLEEWDCLTPKAIAHIGLLYADLAHMRYEKHLTCLSDRVADALMPFGKDRERMNDLVNTVFEHVLLEVEKRYATISSVENVGSHVTNLLNWLIEQPEFKEKRQPTLARVLELAKVPDYSRPPEAVPEML